MLVKELIERLKTLPQDKPVVIKHLHSMNELTLIGQRNIAKNGYGGYRDSDRGRTPVVLVSGIDLDYREDDY